MAICEKEAELVIAKGVEVEVTSDDFGFKDAWYRATIEETPGRSKRKKILVKYSSLVADDGATPLTESIDAAFIRPLPPDDIGNTESFLENEVVDAYHRDGWWTGVVRNVRENFRYWVYFDNPPDVVEFEKKDLRTHFDWIHGKWIRPDKQKSNNSKFSSGAQIEVYKKAEGLEVRIPGIVIKENEDGTFYVKHMSSRTSDAETTRFAVGDRQIRPTPPPFSVRDYDLQEPVDAVHELGWRQGIISKILAGRRYTVSFLPDNVQEEFAHSDLRPHSEWIDGKWIGKINKDQGSLLVQMNQEQLASTNNGFDVKESKIEESTPSTRMSKKKMDSLAPGSNSSPSSLGKQRKPTVSVVGSKHSIHAKNTDTGIVSKTQETVKAGGVMKILDEATRILSTPSLGTLGVKRSRNQGRIRSMNSDQLSLTHPDDNKRKRQDSKGSNVCSIDVITDGVGSERSLPVLAAAKELDSSVVLGLKANPVNEIRANKADGRVFSEATPEIIKDQQKTNYEKAGEKRKEAKAPMGGESNGKKKRGRPPKSRSPQLSQAGQKPSVPKVVSVSDAEKSVAVVPDNIDEDDQPLCTWIVGNIPTGPSSLQTPIGQGKNNAAEMQVNGCVETPSKGENHTLPFSKRSPVWKTIDSMKVFKAVPQKPHFHPLLETKEEYREGTAIGIMVTFANLFDRIASLQFDDPTSTIDIFKESLLDLERHGFDVTVPQGRIQELLSIKDKQAQMSVESNDIQREITEQQCEKEKYNEVVEDIKCKMAELQKQCDHVILLMRKKDNEIANLKLRSDTLNVQVQSQRLAFQKIVNAPWKLP